MTMKSLGLVGAMMFTLAPATAHSQTPASNLVTPQLAAPKAEGHATDTTDRAGLTKKPQTASHTPAPKGVPGWHLRWPHMPRGK